MPDPNCHAHAELPGVSEGDVQSDIPFVVLLAFSRSAQRIGLLLLLSLPSSLHRSSLTVPDLTDSVRSFERTGVIRSVGQACSSDWRDGLVLSCTLPFRNIHPSRPFALSTIHPPPSHSPVSYFLPACSRFLVPVPRTAEHCCCCAGCPHCPAKGVSPSSHELAVRDIATISNYTPSPPR